MFTSVGVGDIIRFEDELYLVAMDKDRVGYICLTYLTGNMAGFSTLRDIDEVCNNIERKYRGIDDYVSALKEKLQKINTDLQYFIDCDDMNREELKECYSIIDFKNKEIERLQKENLKSVNKDTFDKAVNDMLKNEEVSTVEEVSALMKLRALIY